MKLSTLILSVISCGLAAALIAVHYNKGSQLAASRAEYRTLSNQWDDIRMKLEESGKLAEVLQFDLAARGAALETLSNTLAKTEQDLSSATLGLAAAKTDIVAREAQIAKLEGERDDLSRRMEDLNNSITSLEKRIADTQQKLDTAQGDRTYLLAELKRLQDEKAGLVNQFNSLAVLRTQIAKLKEEAAIKQRLAWLRTGVYARQSQKGAERLFWNGPESDTYPNSRLNIEVERNGASRINTVPPPSSAQ